MEIIKSQEEFNQKISEGKVVIDFFAEWCGPCKMMEPFFLEASQEVDGVKFLKLNVDEVETVAEEFGITSIPTMIIFENGQEVRRNTGFCSKQMIIDFVNK